MEKTNFKKSFVFVLALLALTSVNGYATNIAINGEIADGIQTVNVDGRIMAPFKAFLSKFEIGAEWDNENKLVIVNSEKVDIVMAINSILASVNGRTKYMDVPPIIIDGYTYVPIRFLGESMGMKVTWDKDTKTVYFGKKPITENALLNRKLVSTIQDSEINILFDGKNYSFVNSKGESLFEQNYVQIRNFYNGIARVKNQNGLWGCINKDGVSVVPNAYEALGKYNELVMPFMDTGGMFGYIDSYGNKVIDAKYDFASSFVDGKALVMELRNKDIYSSGGVSDNAEGINDGEIISDSGMSLPVMLDNPSYKFQNISEENWMYIDIDGNVLKTDIQLTDAQKQELSKDFE